MKTSQLPEAGEGKHSSMESNLIFIHLLKGAVLEGKNLQGSFLKPVVQSTSNFPI
jgi:hypothetical protein